MVGGACCGEFWWRLVLLHGTFWCGCVLVANLPAPPGPRAGPSSVQRDAVEWREGWGARGAGGERGEVYGGKLTSLTLRPPAPSSVLQRPAGPPRTSESKLQLYPTPPHQPQRPLAKPASGGRAVDATFSSTCFFLAIP